LSEEKTFFIAKKEFKDALFHSVQLNFKILFWNSFVNYSDVARLRFSDGAVNYQHVTAQEANELTCHNFN